MQHPLCFTDATTDKICIMGIVHVRIIGKIKTGERVYASTCYPGKALAESHSSYVDADLLLGMAIESSDELKSEQLVRCFVSFLFGISGRCTTDKIERAMNKKCAGTSR